MPKAKEMKDNPVRLTYHDPRDGKEKVAVVIMTEAPSIGILFRFDDLVLQVGFMGLSNRHKPPKFVHAECPEEFPESIAIRQAMHGIDPSAKLIKWVKE